jgi:hypothetical protein
VLNIINWIVCCAQSFRYVVLNMISWALCCGQSCKYVVLNIKKLHSLLCTDLDVRCVEYYKLGCLLWTQM